MSDDSSVTQSSKAGADAAAPAAERPTEAPAAPSPTGKPASARQAGRTVYRPFTWR